MITLWSSKRSWMALAILAKILVSEITKIKPKPIDVSVVSEILRREKNWRAWKRCRQRTQRCKQKSLTSRSSAAGGNRKGPKLA